MTHFEFISVAVSIILGLGIIQLLSSLDRVLAQPGRYWLHSVWVFMLFWFLIQNWWALWDLKDIAWNLGYFALLVAYVSTLYLTILALTRTNSTEVSWEEIYFSRARVFFGLLAIVTIFAVLLTWILLDVSLLHPYRYAQYSLVAIVAFLFASKQKRLHEVLSGLYITVFVFSQVIFRLHPGLFATTVQ